MATLVSHSLDGITLLSRLSQAERSSLARCCAFKAVGAGQVILDRFSASNGVCFLVAGVARVVHYVADHEEITIATIPAGDTIGEISAVDGLGRSATVVADADCVIAELAQPQFHALLAQHGEVALDLLRRWAETIRKLSDKVSYLSTGSPDQRVYAEILRLAKPDQPGGSRWMIRELPSHQDLARWAQTSREVVAGAVAELVRRGVAERRTRCLHIIDYGMLKSLTLGGEAEPAQGRSA
jgi:CRP/FNR family transcriptional regulator, cyclic AMP receptor protein